MRIEETRRRLARLRAQGLVDRITLPQAGRKRVWFPTVYGARLAGEWPELRGRPASRTVSDPTAVRLKAGHTLTETETALAFTGFDEPVEPPDKLVDEGELITVKVTEVDLQRHRVRLSAAGGADRTWRTGAKKTVNQRLVARSVTSWCQQACPTVQKPPARRASLVPTDVSRLSSFSRHRVPGRACLEGPAAGPGCSAENSRASKGWARYGRPHERHRPKHHRDRASDQLAGCRRLTFPLFPPATGNGPSVVPWRSWLLAPV
ncbi:hypothetical protein ABZ642_33975 [Streptomyces sp. NPDC007157]|uniref:hypothetical protein n=1 Tax=Streptomyces sp. NPDC007157 TaxID=3154681 RepID=UPI0033CF6243